MDCCSSVMTASWRPWLQPYTWHKPREGGWEEDERNHSRRDSVNSPHEQLKPPIDKAKNGLSVPQASAPSLLTQPPHPNLLPQPVF